MLFAVPDCMIIEISTDNAKVIRQLLGRSGRTGVTTYKCSEYPHNSSPYDFLAPVHLPSGTRAACTECQHAFRTAAMSHIEGPLAVKRRSITGNNCAVCCTPAHNITI